MIDPHIPRPIDLPASVPLAADADLSGLDDAKILAAPDDPAQWPAWRDHLKRWRAEARVRTNYDGSRYDAGTEAFVISLAWLWDELLYDHETGTFDVAGYLAAADRSFGGFDGVVLWHAYPNEGVDDRGQFDFYTQVRELPDVVRQFHEHGVHVFVAYYPWEDAATDELSGLVKWLEADGVFVDSSRHGSRAVREALDQVSPDIVLASESTLPLGRVHDHTMSWAQWFADSHVPGVLRAKWFERRHILHHTRRWNRSHLDELHSAWLNGSGVLVWENVFGVWVGWSERDRSLLRAICAVHRTRREWLQSEDWTPLADHPGGDARVYASRFEHAGATLWTVVNRGDEYDGPWLITDAPADVGFAEIAAGIEVSVSTDEAGRTVIGGRLPAGGIAAVVGGEPEPESESAPSSATAPHVGDASFPARVGVRRPVTRAYVSSSPAGFQRVDGGRYDLVVRYRLRETGLYGEAPFVDEWKPLPPRLHGAATMRRRVFLPPFAIAMTEVTNADYAEFVRATGYRPARTERFLAHWAAGAPPEGRGDEPVTHVDLADARAYAAWAQLRLPTEDEWQVAEEAGLLSRGSPAVWNVTESEHSDGRTRFVILKGGSEWENAASEWYFDGGVREPMFSAKYLLCGAGLGRSSSIGFRCAVDLASPESASPDQRRSPA